MGKQGKQSKGATGKQSSGDLHNSLDGFTATRPPNTRRGKPTLPPAEHEARLALYNQGFSDMEIALKRNVTPKTIAWWRHVHGLKSHTPPGRRTGYNRVPVKQIYPPQDAQDAQDGQDGQAESLATSIVAVVANPDSNANKTTCPFSGRRRGPDKLAEAVQKQVAKQVHSGKIIPWHKQNLVWRNPDAFLDYMYGPEWRNKVAQWPPRDDGVPRVVLADGTVLPG